MVRPSKIRSRLSLLMNGMSYLPLSKKWVGCFVMFWIVAAASVSVFEVACAQNAPAELEAGGEEAAGPEGPMEAAEESAPAAPEEVAEPDKPQLPPDYER